MSLTAGCRDGRPHPPLVRWLLLVALATGGSAVRAAPTDLTTVDLESLLQLQVVGASKYMQKQSEVAAAVSVITRQEIKDFGWRTLDEALASLPGVHTTYDRQYNYVGTRGFGLPGDFDTRLLVTVDGNRINDPVFDAGPFGRAFPLDMDLVERIEFIPGPGGAVYGQNAMFGVVNVITRSGADVDGVELAASYQRPQAMREGRISWGKRFDNGFDVLLSVSALRARGEDRFHDFGAAGTSGVATGLDGRRDEEFFARLSYGSWSFQHMYGKHRKDDPTGAYLSDPLVPGSFQGDRYAVTQLGFDDSYVDGTLHLSARVYAGDERYRNRLTYGTTFSSPADSRWRGGEVRLVSTALAGHKLMLGVEFQDNFRLDQAARDEAAPENDLLIARDGYRVGLYVQDEWRITETLTATGGLRVDRNDVTGTKPSPRAGLIWQASPQTTLKALYGRAHRAPNVFERDFDDGITQVANLALRGESIETLELVGDHRVSRDLTLRASIYRWTMDDLVTLGIEPVTGLSQYRSGGSVKARGVELSADKTWAFGARLRGSVSLQDVASANGTAIANSPKVLGKLSLSTPLPWAGLRAGYELNYDSERLTLDGTRLGGYAISNLHLRSGGWHKHLELSLGIHNLFDKRYAHPGADTNWQNALAQDGRTIRVTATYAF